jgi:hypothetical protein
MAVNSVDNFPAKSFACRRKIWKHHQQSSPQRRAFWGGLFARKSEAGAEKCRQSVSEM